MAHRKQILVRSQKNPKEVKVDMAFILDDDSKEKIYFTQFAQVYHFKKQRIHGMLW